MKRRLHECFLNRIQHYINEVPSVGCFYGEELPWLQKSHFLGLVESLDTRKSANNMPRGACSVPECELCVSLSGGSMILPSLWSCTKSSEYEKLSSFFAFVPSVTGIKHTLGRHWGRSSLRFLVCIWRESACHRHGPLWFCWADSRGVPTWPMCEAVGLCEGVFNPKPIPSKTKRKEGTFICDSLYFFYL